jgi:hypothetical protein
MQTNQPNAEFAAKLAKAARAMGYTVPVTK